MTQVNELPDVVILIAAAVFIVALFKRLNLSPVLGYLVAGAAIGEFGFNYVSSADVHVLAEFGIVFLLFSIGIELTFERLMAMRRQVFGFGSLQLFITAFAIGFVAWKLNMDIPTAIVIGGGLALSSTAIVLRVLGDQGQSSSQVGRLSLAVLLLQDFAVVPLLVLVPLLAQHHEQIGVALSLAVGKAIIALLIIFVAGRILLRPLFKVIVAIKSEELFIATTLFIVLGASLATEYFGLSLALGAFIAGLLVAETQYHLQVEESIRPFKGLLMGLFFMSVGMTIDLRTVWENLSTILLLSFGLILLKGLILVGLCKIFRFGIGQSVQSGLLLAQGGEFAFILFNLANQQALLSDSIAQTLLLVVTLTMALTPLLALIGLRFAERFEISDTDPEKARKHTRDISRHVIICGLGRVGKMVARMLSHLKLHYIVIDLNMERVKEGRREGFPVFRGDSTRYDTLEKVGLERASAIIITIDNEVTIERIVKKIREHSPKIPITVRAKDLVRSKKLVAAGASGVVPETYETGLQLGGALLKSIGMSEFDISRLKNQFRAGNYTWAKDISESQEVMTAEEISGNYLGIAYMPVDMKLDVARTDEENGDEERAG
ncbi:MAG: kefC [Rickettsiales bacterium]|jgi:CPA2 family monovalent cation:H+ antiporter-2|nr:kefC [Rickettsiales bacterium]